MRISEIRLLTFPSAILLFFLALSLQPASAQTRVSDKDVQAMMSNLKEDAKSFRGNFDSAVQKSIIRKTSQEKDAKNLVNRFQKETEQMLENFKRTKKGDDIPSVMSTADQVDKLVGDLNLDSPTTSGWQKIRSELGQVSRAFGISEPVSQSSSSVSESNPGSCTRAVGAEHAKKLVAQCMQVSPATHPPCNVQNSCSLIVDEIKRSCELLGRDAPAFCDEYQ